MPLTYCLVGFIGIYVLFELFDTFNRIMETKPDVATVLSFFSGYISPYLEWLFPAALLLGALYTMWNFCRHSEVTAMRANGIGFITIVRPMLAVAGVFALAVAGVNEFYAPWASEQAQNLREERFKVNTAQSRNNINYINQLAHRTWRINVMNLNNPRLLEGVRLSIDRADGSRLVDITSRKAEYLDGQWWFFYPQYQYFDELNTPVDNPTPALAGLVIRSFPELSETPRDFLLMNKKWEHYTVRDMLHTLKTHPNLGLKEKNSMRYDVHARIAAPFSCLIITLFAIPAGVATGRQSVFKGVLCAVALFFGFYATSLLCMVVTKSGYLPAAVGAWMPNLLFLCGGAYLFYRQR